MEFGKKLLYEKIKYNITMENDNASFFKKYWPFVLAVGIGAFMLLTTDKDLMTIIGWVVTVFFSGWLVDKYILKN